MAEKQQLEPELKEILRAEFNKDWRKELRKAIPVKERMKIPRQKMPEREPEERNRDFNEVNLGLDVKVAQIEARRCLDCANPQCILGCPVRIDIPSFIKLIEKGDFIGSARKLKETNSLPAICGRVCPQEIQCELTCTVMKATGVSVAIGNLERFASDYERLRGEVSLPPIPPPTGKKVAIIGAGPAGLTVAGDLAKKGHKITIFEALHVAGGVLVYGIPEFRLPKSILQAEVNYLERLGVELRTNFVVGLSATIEDLKKDGYDAFFVGTGAGLPNFMRIPGENLVGIYSANEYLTRVNLMKAYEFPEYDTPVFLGRKVAVLGGGNVAMDSVRTAKRLGAESSTIVYRRSRVEMPARVEEVKHAEEEGIEFHFLTTPIRYISDEYGRVKAMECLKMKLGEPDSSGRRRPVPVPGSEFTVETENVFSAIGEMPDFSYLPEKVKHDEWVVQVDAETGGASTPAVFAGGDIIEIPHMVVTAIGSGKRSALAIHAMLRGEDVRPIYESVKIGHKGSLAATELISPKESDYLKSDKVVSIDDINLYYFRQAGRSKMPHLAPAERKRSFDEVNLGLPEEVAVQEAARCFNCGVCNGCDNCFVFCPDSTIHRKDGNYWVNYDHCKGCGVCVQECPRSALSLEAEEKWRR